MRLVKIALILILTATIVYSQDNSSIIKFKDITVTIQSLSPFDTEDLKTLVNDRIEFSADLG